MRNKIYGKHWLSRRGKLLARECSQYFDMSYYEYIPPLDAMPLIDHTVYVIRDTLYRDNVRILDLAFKSVVINP